MFWLFGIQEPEQIWWIQPSPLVSSGRVKRQSRWWPSSSPRLWKSGSHWPLRQQELAGMTIVGRLWLHPELAVASSPVPEVKIYFSSFRSTEPFPPKRTWSWFSGDARDRSDEPVPTRFSQRPVLLFHRPRVKWSSVNRHALHKRKM